MVPTSCPDVLHLASLPKPIREIHLILEYHCHLLLYTLQRALINFSVGFSLRK